MTDDTFQAAQIPDDQLTPEQLAKRRECEAAQAKEDSYDNSWKKNEAAGYNCDIKRRVADGNTDFSNLRVDFLGWDFHMKVGEPWQVVRIPGFYHRYDNDLYCYPLSKGKNPQDFKSALIPFDKKWDILKWDFEIKEYTNIRYKWDEIRHSGGVWGKLYRNGKLFHKVHGQSKADVFAYLTVAVNVANSHAACFSHRDWKEDFVGHKVWYKERPCVISAINDWDGVMFRLSADDPTKGIEPPSSWDDGPDGICNKEAWYREHYNDAVSVEWDSPEIKYFRK